MTDVTVPCPTLVRDRGAWRAVMIFALALAVRLAYLVDSFDFPTFDAPIIDSKHYDAMARQAAADKGLSPLFFWQAPYYPFFLTAVYKVGGSPIVAAKTAQAVVGAGTCVLAYWLALSVFDVTIATIAGVMLALYGPAIFFEQELLATGWAMFWGVLLLVLLVRFWRRNSTPLGPPFKRGEEYSASLQIGAVAQWMALGAVGALGVLTRATFLPFVLVVALWLVVRLIRAREARRQAAIALVAGVAGFAVVTIPTATLCKRVTGRFTILPATGGLNLYLGNNPDAVHTEAIRPGREWATLLSEPRRHGHVGVWAEQAYFYGQARDFVVHEPGAFAAGIGRKACELVCSRELPRNLDIYLFRRWSRMLSVLVFKIGAFGFPFGVLLPLAVIGGWSYRRVVPGCVWWFLLLYGGAVVLVFVSARYRMPMIPALVVLAAAGLRSVVASVRAMHWRAMAADVVVLVVVGALTSAVGPFRSEEGSFLAEMQYALGDRCFEAHEAAEAEAHYQAALAARPNYPEVHMQLGLIRESQGRVDEAIGQYREAVRIDPDYAFAHYYLGTIALERHQDREAFEQLRQAVALRPELPAFHRDLAQAAARLDDLPTVIAQARASLALSPDQPHLEYNLGVALLRSGAYAKAEAAFRRAIELQSDFVDAHVRLGDALLAQGRLVEAAALYRQALLMQPSDEAVRTRLERVEGMEKTTTRTGVPR